MPPPGGSGDWSEWHMAWLLSENTLAWHVWHPWRHPFGTWIHRHSIGVRVALAELEAKP